MPWYGWIIVGAIIASSLTTVGTIGKPRKPLEPSTAIVVLLINGLMVWGIVALGVRS